MSSRLDILKGSYRKVDQMPLTFGLPATDEMTDADYEKYVGGDLNDAIRETGISVENIESMSETEYIMENRVVYHILRRFRNSTSVNFKYSTGSDGRSVDKSEVSKTISNAMTEYDKEYKAWRVKSMFINNPSGGSWNRPSSVSLGMDATVQLGGADAKY